MAAGEKSQKLSPSMEDYIEAIGMLIHQRGAARVRDIAEHIGVGMPSVSSALKSLAGKKLVNYDPYEFVTLTEAGAKNAQDVQQRHSMLQAFFVEVLGLSEESAGANACRIEHAADAELLARIAKFAEFVRRPGAHRQWLGKFHAEAKRHAGEIEGETK